MNRKNVHPGHRGVMEDQSPGGRDMGIPPFKTPTLNKGTLQAKESMRDGYHPKMLLYVLDELFYIYAKSRIHRGRMINSCWPTRYYASPPTAAWTSKMGSKRPVCLMP